MREFQVTDRIFWSVNQKITLRRWTPLDLVDQIQVHLTEQIRLNKVQPDATVGVPCNASFYAPSSAMSTQPVSCAGPPDQQPTENQGCEELNSANNLKELGRPPGETTALASTLISALPDLWLTHAQMPDPQKLQDDQLC